jgi:AraC-like DNA-binding protein
VIEFYKKATVALVGLVVLTALVGFVLISRIFVRDALLPARESALPWKIETFSDVDVGGSSSISVNEAADRLDYDFTIRKDAQYPYVTLVLAFTDLENPKRLVDLSRYSTASFRVECAQHNVLSFEFHVFDNKATKPGDFSSYRMPTILFSCEKDWTEVEVDLRKMVVDSWWLEAFGFELSEGGYRLDNVLALSYGASNRGPVNTLTNVKISELNLRGRDWRYAWAFAGFFVVVWGCCIIWLFKQYTRSMVADVKDKLRRDRPLLAYQQLSLQPQEDRKKILLLRFMAEEYADPDLSMEKAITAVGNNRTKINEILRKELGYTFTAYVNKLRLTEAARLLAEKEKASVAEIAYSVGYKNVPYFNTLFKNEYGYAPKTFRSICRSGEAGTLRSSRIDDDRPC